MRLAAAIGSAAAALAVALPGCVTMQAERQAPPIGRFVAAAGARVHLVDLPASQAGGAPVVLIHGASVNLRDMKLALGDALSTRHRVVIVDRPGRGYSSRPADGWRLKRQAEILHAALGELGVERPVVVGQSLGGAVALAYALEYQDEMTGLVLLAPVSHEWPGGIAWYNRVSQWPIAGALFRRLVLPIYAPLAANSGVANTFAPDAPPEGYAEATGLALLFRPADFKSNAADIARLKPQVAAMSRRYREIRIPTAILAGASDRTVSPHIHARALARDIPGATLQILPETGHALHHAQTARVAAAIESVAD